MDPFEQFEKQSREAAIKRKGADEVFHALPEYRQAFALEAIAYLLSIIAGRLVGDDPTTQRAINRIMKQFRGDA